MAVGRLIEGPIERRLDACAWLQKRRLEAKTTHDRPEAKAATLPFLSIVRPLYANRTLVSVGPSPLQAVPGALGRSPFEGPHTTLFTAQGDAHAGDAPRADQALLVTFRTLSRSDVVRGDSTPGGWVAPVVLWRALGRCYAV